MLVLSRRETETVVFPGLGITVEVSRVKGKTVRLGIDAPDEIRVIRGELANTANLSVALKPDKDQQYAEIQQRLNATNLAIHLAQNQLRQQLTGHAEEALDNALECLEELERALACWSPVDQTTRRLKSNPYQKSRLQNSPLQKATVREAQATYNAQPSKLAVILDSCLPVEDLSAELAELGYKTLIIDSARDLIQFLKRHEQPNLVITSTEYEPDQHSGLRLYGVGSLQKSQRRFTINRSNLTFWFSDLQDESALSHRLQS